MTDQIGFKVSPELAAAIDSRTREGGSANLTARRDLERYYSALRYALASVELAEGEAKLVCDALNECWEAGVTTPSEARAHLSLEVEDAIRLHGAAKKWGVDSDKLRSTIAHLDDVQALAVMDAVERFWAGDETVESVGLYFDDD